ncbi:MAG: peptidylprolyl isomerase [Apilactobacillus sp.]|uniref:peptidylprolyl isomerase n=1 Tax=Apilactobacillus TaxID=2767877 RepID=UPI0025D57FC7|nr:peptidylprolyl isomerase [Apilactobacillus sp.]MCT6822813.1 peptidylprolyl isomerase [Apilactobacillus sp.]MCT6857879.1 peptidylprolyl isomerase [Apilactobacillus sp.]
MSNYPQMTSDKDSKPLAILKTNFGDVQIALFPKEAPQTVENFIKLAEVGYYDGTTFHRVIKDFMIQGGDPTATGAGGESIWNKPFDDEFSKKLYNFRGALSMANAGPNTNGSQFFIVQSSKMPKNMKKLMEDASFEQEVIDHYLKNGGTPWLDFRHTVFGQVVDGMEIVDKIAATKVDISDKPTEDVIINKVEIFK